MKPKITYIVYFFILSFGFFSCGGDEQALENENEGLMKKKNKEQTSEIKSYCPSESSLELFSQSELIRADNSFKKIKSVKAFRKVDEVALEINIFIANTDLEANSSKEILSNSFEKEEAVLTFVLHQYSNPIDSLEQQKFHFSNPQTNLHGEVFILLEEGNKLIFDKNNMQKTEFQITQINESEICGSFFLSDNQTQIKGEFVAPFLDIF